MNWKENIFYKKIFQQFKYIFIDNSRITEQMVYSFFSNFYIIYIDNYMHNVYVFYLNKKKQIIMWEAKKEVFLWNVSEIVLLLLLHLL